MIRNRFARLTYLTATNTVSKFSNKNNIEIHAFINQFFSIDFSKIRTT